MLHRLMDIWIYIWFAAVPIITFCNIFLTYRLIKKIERVNIEQKNIDIIKEMKDVLSMYIELKKYYKIKD